MKRFKDLLGENPSEAAVLASQWCDSKLDQLPEIEWLQWAGDRITRRGLLKLEVAKVLFQHSAKGPQALDLYVRFVAEFALQCAEFYRINGGEMTPEVEALMEKEKTDTVPLFQVPPKKAPETEQKETKGYELEERDGVTFIKNTNFVLSKFL